VGDKVVPSLNIPKTYYGSDLPPSSVVDTGAGFEARTGTRDLYAHQAGLPSEFRGTSENLQVAAGFAQEGQWVYELRDVRGYDLNQALQGRVGPPGSKSGSMVPGEQEIAVESRIPVERIARYGQVVSSPSGKLYVKDWVDVN
jgi:hypothetical protein